MSDKKYTPKEAAQELLKSLHRSIAKADPALRNILSDLEDSNAKKDLPEDLGDSAVPTPVLYKQDQAKPPKLSQPAGPKIGAGPKNHVSPNIGQMAVNAAPKAPSAPKPKMSMSLPKSEEKGIHPAIAARTPEGAKTSPSGRHDTKEPSLAGIFVERSKKEGPVGIIAGEQAKNKHKEVLSDLRSMPKPNLPKSEEGGEGNLQGMGKLRSFLEQRKLKKTQPLDKAKVDEGKTDAQKRHSRIDSSGMHRSGVKNAMDTTQGIRTKSGHAEQARVVAKENLERIQSMPKPNLPKSEEGMAKTEYTPREVAIEVLKKAESILKAKKQDWDDHKIEKNKMVDPFMDETREVVNENDINEEAKMALYNSSKKRLDSFLAKRKAKKNKKED